MSIGISITGLTTQQQQDVGDAFDQTIPGRQEAGLTKAQWVQLNMLRHLKAVVKNWKRRDSETALGATFAQIETDYPEA